MGLINFQSGSENTGVKLNINVGGTPTILPESIYEGNENNGKPKKPRTKKIGDAEVVTTREELPMMQSNVPYQTTFSEPTAVIRSSIAEFDQISGEVQQDLTVVRNSKTMAKKYDYIGTLQQQRIAAITGKLNAAKAMADTIKTGHDLDMKRAKETKAAAASEVNDARSIQQLYNAFIQQPMSQGADGTFVNPLTYATGDITMNNPMLGMMSGLNINMDPDAGYQKYLNNLSPEQVTMLIEENPNIEHVVAYDRNTGSASFAVYDKSTNSFLNVPSRNNEMYLNGLTWDFDNGVARSNDLNESYSIVWNDGGTTNTVGASNVANFQAQTGIGTIGRADNSIVIADPTTGIAPVVADAINNDQAANGDLNYKKNVKNKF